ncbi:unnamed protein product [Pleuronectes platessa]|uniref:Uncharacterized protein n=1 Tax=Pleuronectes platessa TaxID=8262 RepID=A0A9N7V715_PLEPL|nr:unnamed protein product [Pleuronectes platessa]
MQAPAPGSLEFGQTYTAPDSAAAPDPPLVSDFCHGPAGAPPKDTSPTTTSTQKPSLFGNSYSSMQAEAPGSLEFVGGSQFEGASEDWDPNPEPVWRPPHYTSSSSGDPTNTTSSTTTSTLKHSLFGYSYSSMQAPAPGSLEFDSAAAPDPPLVSDFCHGPAGAPPKDTSPTTTSTQKPSLFDNSYSSMQAEAPGSLEFGQTYTAPVGGSQFEGASEDWDPNPEPVWRPPHYTSSSSGDPTNTTSSTTTSTLKHSLFGYSYSSMQAPAPGSLEFDSAAAPDPPLVSDFCHGPAGAPPKDTSPTTTSTQKPSLFDNSYSSMQAEAPGSLEFDSAAAPKTFFFSSAGDPTNTTSSTTTFFQ